MQPQDVLCGETKPRESPAALVLGRLAVTPPSSHAHMGTAIPWCSSRWAAPSNALIFSQLPETPQLVLPPRARTQPGGSSSEVLAATTDLSQRQASGFSHIALSLSDLG